jgi:pilus assembly protein CpaF
VPTGWRMPLHDRGWPQPRAGLSPERSPAQHASPVERDEEPAGQWALPLDLEEAALNIYERLLQELDTPRLARMQPSEAEEAVREAARREVEALLPDLPSPTREQVVRRISWEVLGLGPLEPLLSDPEITEIMVNAPDLVFIERGGKLRRVPVRFRDAAHIMRIVQRILAPLGRHVDEASPMVDARLPDGSRVNIIVPPLCPRSPVITIRRFRERQFSLEELVALGSMPAALAEFLAAAVRARANILISGGTGSGKTTMLSALAAHIPEEERIITIEDPIELRLHREHVIQLEARPPGIEGRGEVTQRDLLRNALRMRPDRIIVGEVRGPEAFDMLNAMNTGHEGSLSTIHANSVEDALHRLENMVLMAGFDLPLRAVREQVASALHLVVQVARLADGRRRVVQVMEVLGMEGDQVSRQEMYRWRQTGVDASGRILGHDEVAPLRPRLAERLEAAGLGSAVSALMAMAEEVEAWR